MYEELVTYRREWGTADAPLGNELGRWCQTQRRLRSHDKLEAAKIDQLDAVGFSWVSPSAPEDVETDWDERVVELAAYSTSHGDGQVPKKYKANPRLGGWVAAVRRRGRGAFATTQLAQLEEAGFEWISIRRCGSQFMKYWRELRDFHASHGHAEPPLGSPLRAWARTVLPWLVGEWILASEAAWVAATCREWADALPARRIVKLALATRDCRDRVAVLRAAALSRAGSEEIRRAVSDGDARVRRQALELSRQRGLSIPLAAIVARARDDDDDNVAAVEVLGTMLDEATVSVAVRLATESPRGLWVVARGARKWDARAADVVFRKVMSGGEDYGARTARAHADLVDLLMLFDPATLAALPMAQEIAFRLFDDRDQQERLAARHTLQVLVDHHVARYGAFLCRPSVLWACAREAALQDAAAVMRHLNDLFVSGLLAELRAILRDGLLIGIPCSFLVLCCANSMPFLFEHRLNAIFATEMTHHLQPRVKRPPPPVLSHKDEDRFSFWYKVCLLVDLLFCLLYCLICLDTFLIDLHFLRCSPRFAKACVINLIAALRPANLTSKTAATTFHRLRRPITA
ncbi:hypothetical protein CTAYLR_009398 [Chrysophaeum taylorii]|uniref:Helicase-associated domain-containing protein n=1 Tax=Chrysophaeum taylorii TaxID=2483200 RepID=A0AAD7UKB2_9STRA|nr:hypothetical protein CTAYLR_009398 [Chrysophaeum taylorii]